MMDRDTEAAHLTAAGLRGGSLRGTHRLHRHGIFKKFWCDMIMASYYIKSVSLPPVCVALPGNAALRIWASMGVNNASHVSQPGGCCATISAHNRLPSPKLWVTSWALYMALFSKHCSSHYHHHMLLALSPLINAPILSHLERFSGGKARGIHSKVYCEKLRGYREMCEASSIPNPIAHPRLILTRARH